MIGSIRLYGLGANFQKRPGKWVLFNPDYTKGLVVPGNFGDNFKNFDIITTPKLQ